MRHEFSCLSLSKWVQPKNDNKMSTVSHNTKDVAIQNDDMMKKKSGINHNDAEITWHALEAFTPYIVIWKFEN